MGIYTGLLFDQGHIQDPELARSLAQAQAPPDAPSAGGSGAAVKDTGRALPHVRRGRGWVDLEAALLSAFR